MYANEVVEGYQTTEEGKQSRQAGVVERRRVGRWEGGKTFPFEF